MQTEDKNQGHPPNPHHDDNHLNKQDPESGKNECGGQRTENDQSIDNKNPENDTNPKSKEKSSSNKQKLSLEDFEISGSLGNGSFGEVSLVKKKGSEQYYAMKSINKNFLFKVYGEKEIFTYIIYLGKKTISSLC